jgi:hypothetical protein
MRPIYSTHVSNIAASSSGHQNQKWSNSIPSATQSMLEVTSSRSRSINSPISKSIDETINKLLSKAANNFYFDQRSINVNRRKSLQLQQQPQQQKHEQEKEQTNSNKQQIKQTGSFNQRSPHQRSSSLISRHIFSPPSSSFMAKQANSSMSPTQLIGVTSPPFLPHTPITPCNTSNPFYCSSSSSSPLMGNGVGGPGNRPIYKISNEFASPFCSSPNVDSTNTSLFSSQLKRIGQHQLQHDPQNSILNEKRSSTEMTNSANHKVTESSTLHQQLNISDCKSIASNKRGNISLNGTIDLIDNLEHKKFKE